MYKCKKCGICCKSLNKSPIYDELHNGDGICKYLENNLCRIYENRPLLCRIDESYIRYFKSIINIGLYHKLNYIVCDELNKINRE